MNGARSVLDEIAARWDDHGQVTEGAFQLVLEGPERVEVYVAIEGGRATVHDGVHAAPLGVIVLPAALLVRFAEHAETFDLRFLDDATKQSIQFAGDTSFVAALLQAIRRPPESALRRLALAEERAAGRPRVRAVERHHRPSAGAIEEAMRASIPIVATGALDRWSVEDWSFERLAAEHGDVPLTVIGPPTTLGQLIREMSESPATGRYVQGCPLPEELGRVFVPPSFVRQVLVAQLWMGVLPERRPTARLHRDLSDGLLAQVAGRKRVVFYSPDQAPCLYPFKSFNTFQPCWVEPWAPDLERFPRFRDAEAIEVTLSPGEVLVNPAGWFHCIYAMDPTMSVSFAVPGD